MTISALLWYNTHRQTTPTREVEMMITPSTIYWITRLDAICVLAAIFAICGTLLSIGAWAFFFVAGEEDRVEAQTVARKVAMVLTTIAINGIVASCFVPTTKEAAAMLVLPKVANSESVQHLGDGIVDLANQWLEELSPKKVEAK